MKVRVFLSLVCASLLGALQGCVAGESITLPRLPAWRAPANPAPVAWSEVTAAVRRLAPNAQLATSDAAFTRVNRQFAAEVIAWTRALVDVEEHTPGDGLHYTPESFDCDKFAKAFTLAVELAAGRAGVKAQPLAARIYVRQEAPFGGVPAARPPADGHALVALATDEGVLIVEPQTGECVPLEQYPNRATIWRVSIGG